MYNKFWNKCKEDAKIVATWPKWKRDIIISAKTASTGNFTGGK